MLHGHEDMDTTLSLACYMYLGVTCISPIQPQPQADYVAQIQHGTDTATWTTFISACASAYCLIHVRHDTNTNFHSIYAS